MSAEDSLHQQWGTPDIPGSIILKYYWVGMTVYEDI